MGLDADFYSHPFRMFDRIDDHAKVFWYLWLMNRWLALRLSLSGAAFATVISAVIVSTKGINASIAGFALSFALQYGSAMVSVHSSLCFKIAADLEPDMDYTTVGSFCSDEIELVN